jgi:membrane fusion protein (multidrug efflux system)
VVDGDNKVSAKAVTASRTLGDSWVVESGLQDGDRVVVSGVQRVKTGMQVRAVAALATARSA